jgi:hypothetical protein
MWSAIHQFTLVGGADYESKELRLEETLARLPPGSGTAVVVADKGATSAVEAIVARHRAASAQVGLAKSHNSKLLEIDSNASTRASNADSGSEEVITESSVSAIAQPVAILVSDSSNNSKGHALDLSNCQFIINYSFPTSGRKYLEQVAQLSLSSAETRVIFTLVDESDLGSRRCREVMALIRRAKKAAEAHSSMAGVGKIAEFQAALQQLDPKDDEEEEGEEEKGGEEEWDDSCDCCHCQGSKIGSRSYHAPDKCGTPRVEAVHVHLRALENMAVLSPVIASGLKDHVCTLVCLHCLYCHTPWDGDEDLFALPDGMGAVRVVFVLAEGVKWHEYPDSGSLYGGTPWSDMLDMASMDKTDQLLEKLVDHEIDLLNGHSERLMMMGVSQGGCQAMLRFLRSRQKLGGWIGGVTHAPTMPHTPQDQDPLLGSWRSSVNCGQPLRFLAGGADSVFPPAMILRDAERLRTVGGFTDIKVEVAEGLAHDDYLPDTSPVKNSKSDSKSNKNSKNQKPSREEAIRRRAPDLHFMRKHLPAMLGLAPAPDQAL